MLIKTIKNMPKLTIEKIETKIVSLLTSKKSGYSSRELRIILGVSKNKKSIFKKALSNLISKGNIYKIKEGKHIKWRIQNMGTLLRSWLSKKTRGLE